MKRRDLLKRLVTVPIIGKLITETPAQVKPVAPPAPPPAVPTPPVMSVKLPPQHGYNLTSCSFQMDIGEAWWEKKS